VPEDGDPENFLGVYGHTNVDHIAHVPAFPPMNQSIEILHFEHLWGGTAANIAAVAAKQGVPVALASFVGHGFPPQFAEHLRALGLDLTDLTTIEEHPTPECYIYSDGKDNQIAFMIQGPMEHADVLYLQRHTLESSSMVHLATGNPRYHLKAAKEARALGRSVCFDPGQEIHYKWDPETFSEMLDLADLLFLSEAETRCTLEYTDVPRLEDILDTVPSIIMTLGRWGSVMLTEEGRVEVPSVEARHVEDTTGAGDAFRGGYYSGLWRGLPQRDCLLLGASTASFVVETRGPQTNMPTFEEAWERAQKSVGGGAD
jgi:sugar/nucleoside kinase (ribokinase family)